MCKRVKKDANHGMSKTEKAIRHRSATFKIIPEGGGFVRLLVNGQDMEIFISYEQAFKAAIDIAKYPESYDFVN